MKASVRLLSGLACVSLLAGLIGCASMLGKPTDQLLLDPAIHILVNNELAIPEQSTFDFDTKLFKVNYSEEVDLAAIDDRVVGSLLAELKRKGFRQASEGPDLLVSYALALDSSISGGEFNEAYADAFPIDVPEPGPNEELDYHQGALIVDFVDSNSRKLLWRGSIMANVDMDVSEREKDRRIRHAARILLDHFPRPIQEGQAGFQ